MKIMFRTTLIAGALSALIFSGCDKAKDAVPEPATTSTAAPTITISDGYGALAAVRSVS
jgi:hypothetical protein